MFNSCDIVRLYDNVLKNEINEFCVADEDIRQAIRNMKEVYKPNKTNWKQEVSFVAYYNDIAHRCAYLHKYAPLHTEMVQEMFRRALIESNEVYKSILFSRMDGLKICSLGGGPGTDVIGVLAAVHELFGFHPCSAQIVELMSGWELTCSALLGELEYGGYGSLSENISSEYFNCSYLTADLLGAIDIPVSDEIGSADLITMVKFVSAATSKNTATMVENIFSLIKPGALILFIDNAAGGFGELLLKLGDKCNLLSVFGPLHRVHYANKMFSIRRYGYTSCFETTVTVQILKKQDRNGQAPKVRYDENLILRLQNHLSASIQNNISISRNHSSDFILCSPSSLPDSPAVVPQCESFQYSQTPNRYSSTGRDKATNSSPIMAQRDEFIVKKPHTIVREPHISQNCKTKIIGYEPFNNVRNMNGYFIIKSDSASNQVSGDNHENNIATDNLTADSKLLNPDELASIKDGFMNVLANVTNRIKSTFRTIIPIFNDNNFSKEGS